MITIVVILVWGVFIWGAVTNPHAMPSEQERRDKVREQRRLTRARKTAYRRAMTTRGWNQ